MSHGGAGAVTQRDSIMAITRRRHAASDAPIDYAYFVQLFFEITASSLIFIAAYTWRDAAEYWFYRVDPQNDTPAGHYIFAALVTLISIIVIIIAGLCLITTSARRQQQRCA